MVIEWWVKIAPLGQANNVQELKEHFVKWTTNSNLTLIGPVNLTFKCVLYFVFESSSISFIPPLVDYLLHITIVITISRSHSSRYVVAAVDDYAYCCYCCCCAGACRMALDSGELATWALDVMMVARAETYHLYCHSLKQHKGLCWNCDDSHSTPGRARVVDRGGSPPQPPNCHDGADEQQLRRYHFAWLSRCRSMASW